MKFKKPLSPSTVRRLIGPISESAPGYSMMRAALESPVVSEAHWICRKIARLWCAAHAVVRLLPPAQGREIRNEDRPRVIVQVSGPRRSAP